MVGNDSYSEFARRVLVALGKRVADGDVEGLRDMVRLRDELDNQIAAAATTLNADPWNYSWAEIGRVLETSRQYAHKRYGRPSSA